MRRMLEFIRKNTGRLVVITAVLLLLCSAALAASYPYTTTTNDQVNLRRSASTSSALVDRIPAGGVIEVLGDSGNYFKVTYNGRTGYVVKQYVNAAPDSSIVQATAEPTASGYPYTTTTNDSVNLRAKKSTSSARLASIPEGATITVRSISGSYAEVTYNGKDGWVLKEYVNLKTIVKPTATPKPTATLSPAASSTNYTVLQVGSTGTAVTALQEALIELGYLSGSADGIFGTGTQSAVVSFQTKNEYPATGIADENLQAFLYSGKPKNSQGTKTDVKTLPPISGVKIYLNDKGALVISVQTRLKELGYYTGAISGTYDKATRTAVVAFQKKSGLSADGICGEKTQEALFSSSALSPDATATPKPTASPTPAPTFQIPSDTVRRGDEGEDAKLVQKRLIELGYLTGKADGKFGSASQAALKKFQQKHGLKADGVAGGDTFAILFSHNALSQDAIVTAAPTAVPVTPAPTATPTPAPLTKENCITIRKGVSGDVVKRLQQRLTELGYYISSMDGVCKDDDVAAIKAFQRANGLSVDGVAGYDTQSKLYSLSAITDGGAMAGGTVDSYTTLRKGMSGDTVQQMQERLIVLGYLAQGEADGKYGTGTAEAVYAFQKRNGLVRDGVAGSKTLAKLYSTAAATPTPQPEATTPAPDKTITIATNKTLRKGDVNSSVKAMQTRLIDLGYLTGSADGNFGAQTYKALKAFQTANALEADGIAGKATLTALNSVNAQGSGSSSSAPSTVAPSVSVTRVTAADVMYAYWYSTIRAQARKFQYATVYDYQTGISWQVHMFSLGAHADSEPLTAADTAKMLQAFGGHTWNPRPLWVILGNGEVYLATSHSMEHGTYHIRDNDFNGHVCLHFPRTMSQVTAIGTYATSHQKAIDKAWAVVQDMASKGK